MSGNQNISFFQGELHRLKYQMLSEDLLISYRYASAYPYQLQQCPSTDPDKGLLNGSSGSLTDTYRLVFSYQGSLQFESELICQLVFILLAKGK